MRQIWSIKNRVKIIGNFRQRFVVTSQREHKKTGSSLLLVSSVVSFPKWIHLFAYIMPRRCVYYNCSTRDNNLYLWPSDPVIRRQWTAFVTRKRDKWRPSDASVLCGKHFAEGCFYNYIKYSAGFAKRWVFYDDSVVIYIQCENWDYFESLETNL